MSNDKKLFEISCREYLMEITKDSEVINKDLSFFEKILLYDKIREMPFTEVVELLFKDHMEEAREIETKDDRDTKYGAAMTAGGYAAYKVKKFNAKKLKNVKKKGLERTITKGIKNVVKKVKPVKKFLKTKSTNKTVLVGSAIGASLMFLYRRITDPCFKQSSKILNPRKKKIAILKCKNTAITKVIGKIRSDFNSCAPSKNPEKCRNQLTTELNKWRQKYQDNLIEINKSRTSED